MKFFAFVFLVIFLLGSCNERNSKQQAQQEKIHPEILKEVFKRQFYSLAKKFDSTYHIYSIVVTRLARAAVINLHPVIDNSYLTDNTPPYLFFEYGDVLFLIYSGAEELVPDNFSQSAIAKQKYDSVCARYHVSKISMTYDPEPLFRKISGDSLVEYNNPHLINAFYYLPMDTTGFSPVEIR